MPSNETVRRQRFLGGALGVAVLGSALVYHFFPRVFHVNPEAVAPRHTMLPIGTGVMSPAYSHSTPPSPANAEIDAGPPLTLAPSEVIAARMSKRNMPLPKQLSEDPPEVQALLGQAAKALRQGHVIGDNDSAAALYAQALKAKPDSRHAMQGMYEVRSRLVAQIGQDIAVGDAEAARQLLDALRTLPNASDEAAQLETSLKTLLKVRPMLAQAAALLAQGKADRPSGASALDLYHQVQQLDPQNAMAEQGVFQVQRAVLDRALAAVAQNDFAAADNALKEADAIRPGSQQMLDVRNRVEGMRQQRASGLLAQARSALDAGNLKLGEQLANQAKAISPDLAGIGDFEERLTNARLYASYKPGQVFSDRYVDLPGQTPAMVVIPTGSFQMGAPDDEQGRSDAEIPRHTVSIAQGFAMGRSAVTVGQFREFVRASGYKPDSIKLGGASVYDERSGALRDDTGATWQDDYAGHPAADKLPVVNVSWNDAEAYANWLSQRTGKRYRLPSEAEFEYAMRGGTDTRYWWGNGVPSSRVENTTGEADRSPSGRRWSNAFKRYHDGYWGPAPVMSFAPNPFGLYDIDGNVSEWVADCWHDSYIRAPRDGSAWVNPGCSIRVVRGGSWGSSPDQERSAYRQGADASVRSGRVGFRIVREL
jgi:formylglycine-generating enzyme required for sulfatase activity